LAQRIAALEAGGTAVPEERRRADGGGGEGADFTEEI